MTLDVKVELKVYERNGKETQIGEIAEKIFVRSHWNDNGPNGRVIMTIGKETYTVLAREMISAIERCVDL